MGSNELATESTVVFLQSTSPSTEPRITYDLLIGVVASLIAVWLAYALSKHFRGQLTRFALRLLKAGVDCVYPNQAAAEHEIITATQKAETVRVLGMRGRSLVEGYLTFLIRDRPFREIAVLLADPDAPAEYNPVTARAREIEAGETGLDVERYTEDGRDALRAFYRWNANNRCSLKVYQFPAVLRLVATEEVMFLSFYPSTGRGKDNVMVCLPHESPFYRMANRYFECVWRDVRSHEPVNYARVADNRPLSSQG